MIEPSRLVIVVPAGFAGDVLAAKTSRRAMPACSMSLRALNAKTGLGVQENWWYGPTPPS